MGRDAAAVQVQPLAAIALQNLIRSFEVTDDGQRQRLVILAEQPHRFG